MPRSIAQARPQAPDLEVNGIGQESRSDSGGLRPCLRSIQRNRQPPALFLFARLLQSPGLGRLQCPPERKKALTRTCRSPAKSGERDGKGLSATASLAAKTLLKLFGLCRPGPYTSHTKPESVELERFPVLRPGIWHSVQARLGQAKAVSLVAVKESGGRMAREVPLVSGTLDTLKKSWRLQTA